MAQWDCQLPPFTLAILPVVGETSLELLLATGRAGEFPLLDVTRPEQGRPSLERALPRLFDALGPRFGVRLEEATMGRVLEQLEANGQQVELLLLAGHAADLEEMTRRCRPWARRLFREVISEEEAEEARRCHLEGLVAKGNESGGRVGTETTFVLLQRLVRRNDKPIWVQGGITPQTLAACLVAGACGAVLEGPLALAEESTLPEGLRGLLQAMDGTETICLGESLGEGFRVHRLKGTSTIRELQNMELTGSLADFRKCLQHQLGETGSEPIWPVGQEAALASRMAGKYRNVAGILRAYRAGAVDNLKRAVQSPPLGENSVFARAHGLRYPIFQGPMTRVSDVAGFAEAVAQAGALPFLALALLRETETRTLLEQTAALLGERRWGVGLLAFLPAELRAEQMRAVLAVKPPYAILAGGRPDQAKELEKAGIVTFLHTPSPRLLEMFLREGARRFIFEGRECGGHVGPLSSFMLWDAALEVLSRFQGQSEEPVDLLLAGGIHDGLSAAMVSALAAGALEEGKLRLGVLMGTAYLFTHEAVKTGAIVPTFQAKALACENTVLLDAQGGHAIRCVPSRYAEEFHDLKRRLMQAGLPPQEVREKLEEVNIGRLRIASKGLKRPVGLMEGPPQERGRESHLVPVSSEEQQREGMYMIGSVGALRHERCSMAELHEDVAKGSVERLERWRTQAKTVVSEEPIAIVGMACLFPDAADLEQFWSNILRLHSSISEVPAERWRSDIFYHSDPMIPDRVVSKWGGFLDPVPFDPLRFGIPPASIPSIEPMQLLVLLVAQQSLEDAGYERRPLARERTAVIIGAGGGACDLGLQYQTRAMVEHYLSQATTLDARVRDETLDTLRTLLPALTEDSFPGTLCNVAAGRVANRFDFAGPNFAVDAACASSLAALDMGVKELRQYGSDVVFLGGGDAQMNISSYLMFSKTHALSPRGRCRPFDAQADGIAISEGLAGIILKRLKDAQRDGDRIYAVLRAVGSASDGRDKSLTAPSLQGQVRTLRRAYASEDLSPATVGLVEAHGTGTVVGDRTELQALCELFQEKGAQAQSCALGSVKSQIGHTKNGAGLAGLIKAILALHHRTLPPTLVEEPSPAVRDRSIPFYLNTRPRPWFHHQTTPRRAGVSAFGFGGTNFHVVLEEYSGHTMALTHRPCELFLFRAMHREELAARLRGLSEQLEKTTGIRPIDLAWLCQREAATARGECRLAVVASTLEELRGRLRATSEALQSESGPSTQGGIAYAEENQINARGKVAFLFPGQGSQYLNMLEELALYFPVVREVFEEADRVLEGLLPKRLTQVIFPPPAYSPQEEVEQRRLLDQTWYAQPALGAAGYALYRLLTWLGIEPEVLAGHSYGEYVALTAAEVWSLEDLLRLSERRGRLVQQTQGCETVAMLAVQASVEKLQPLLQGKVGLAVAAWNAPEQTVVGGETQALEELQPQLEKARLGYQKLAVSAGFHIPQARAAAKEFGKALGEIRLGKPQKQIWSNRTAEVYPAEGEAIRRLLEEHLTHTVRFREQIEAMAASGCRTFVEVGPGQVLTGLMRLTLGERDDLTLLATNRRGPGGALAGLLESVGRLWVLGLSTRVDRLFGQCALHPWTMADLGKGEKPLPPTTWMLDGGSARPLKPRSGSVSSTSAKPTVSPRVRSESSAARTSTVGAEVEARRTTAGSVRSSSNVKEIFKIPENHSASEEVLQAFQASMRQFLDYQARAQEQRQQLMQQFLQTQTTLVQALLQGQGNGSVALPAGFALPVGTERVDEPKERVVAEVAEVAEVNGVVETASGGSSVHELLALPREERAGRLKGMLLELVSERTGYPEEMLELDHNMEADLGIDSIKRTEIFGGLRDRLGFHGEQYEKEEYYIKLGKLRTLGEVLNWLTEEAVAAKEEVAAADSEEVRLKLESSGESKHGTNGRAHGGQAAVRLTLQVEPAPLLEGSKRASREREVILVTDGPGGRGRRLFSLLRGLDYELVFVRHGKEAKVHSPGNYEIDLLSPESGKQLRGWVEEHHGSVTALCHLLPLDPNRDVDSSRCLEVRSLFHLTTTFGLDLVKNKGTVLGVLGMGGDFGVQSAAGNFTPGQAAVAGFLKSLAREWQDVHVKVLDVEPTLDDASLLGAVVTEFETTDRKIEVGYGPKGRSVIAVQREEVQQGTERRMELEENSVVLLLGGARGITAAIAEALARRYRSRLLLVGRSPLPEEESEETKGLSQAAELKRALAERRRRRGEMVTPALVEGEYRALLASRELRGNLERLSHTGATIHYQALDVRDEEGLTELVRCCYEKYGRLDGVIHAAGLLGDSLLLGKSADGFDRIFDTKVKPALVLARELRPEKLKFLVFFSSVSARFGNIGQTDYAAGNETLNKLAGKLDREWPGRVVSIGWGPWDEVGMARPEKMSVEYLATIGFAHMPVEEGCEKFVEEIEYGRKGETEVLILRPEGKGPSETSYSEAQFYLRAGKR